MQVNMLDKGEITIARLHTQTNQNKNNAMN